MSEGPIDERWTRGLDVVDSLYGPGWSETMAGLEEVPLGSETVRHMFGEIWSRPGLSTRDKRLLVIGVSTMLGRVDLLEIQLAGAIFSGDLNAEELDEIALLMLFYAGAANSAALHRAIEAAKRRAGGMAAAGRDATADRPRPAAPAPQ